MPNVDEERNQMSANVTGAIANIQEARVDVRNAALSGELPSHVADNTDIILAAVERGLMEHESEA